MENKKMSRQDRAKQFLPFAALKGYYEYIQEKEKIIVEKRSLSETDLDNLSKKMNLIKKNDIVTVSYYNIDHYDKITGIVSKIDLTYRFITIVKTKIDFDDVSDIVF